jgi:hypothetical protein
MILGGVGYPETAPQVLKSQYRFLTPKLAKKRHTLALSLASDS